MNGEDREASFKRVRSTAGTLLSMAASEENRMNEDRWTVGCSLVSGHIPDRRVRGKYRGDRQQGPDDTFWQPVKKGVDDARKVVELTGGKVSFSWLANYDNLGPDAANLVRTAVSQGVDGIVVANWVPDAMDAA